MTIIYNYARVYIYIYTVYTLYVYFFLMCSYRLNMNELRKCRCFGQKHRPKHRYLIYIHLSFVSILSASRSKWVLNDASTLDYHLSNSRSYGKWPVVVDWPVKKGDFSIVFCMFTKRSSFPLGNPEKHRAGRQAARGTGDPGRRLLTTDYLT